MTYKEAVETIKTHYPNEGYTMLREALDVAIDALKAQEPKAVIGIPKFDQDISVGKCPACDKWIVNQTNDLTKFCKYCGQAVKWNG